MSCSVKRNAKFFMTRDGIFKSSQFVSSLILTIFSLTTRLVDERAATILVVLGIASACCVTLAFSGLIYYLSLYERDCAKSLPWARLETGYAVACAVLHFVAMCLSAALASEFSNSAPISSWILCIICSVFSALTMISFIAFVVAIKRCSPIVSDKRRSQQNQQAANISSVTFVAPSMAHTQFMANPIPRFQYPTQVGAQYSTQYANIQYAPQIALQQYTAQNTAGVQYTTQPAPTQTIQRSPLKPVGANPTRVAIDLRLEVKDITQVDCEAIVNPSNKEMQLMEQGISGCILRKGGRCLQGEMYQARVDNGDQLLPGNAVSTIAGNLPMKRIIHTAGPEWHSGANCESTLRSSVLNCLKEASRHQLKSLAIPAIGCGANGGNPNVCVPIIVDAVVHYNKIEVSTSLRQVVFVEERNNDIISAFRNYLNHVKGGNNKVDICLVRPPEWEDMAGHQWKKAVLPPSSTEYQHVLALFNLTLAINVVTIERVQNPTLYNQFHAQRKKVADCLANAGSNQPAAMELFHGTAGATCDAICKDNFDRSHSGINGKAFGSGVYFATTAKYSDGFAKGNPKHMFLAEVITGKYCKGAKSMKVPPKQPNGSPYDSVVDDVTNPSKFVVFRDASVYPSYLVTYT